MTDSQLMYPRPLPDQYELHRALHDLQEDEGIFNRFLDDPYAALSNYDLSQADAKLVADKDYDGLRDRGIHPVLIVNYQRRIEWGLKLTGAKDSAAGTA